MRVFHQDELQLYLNNPAILDNVGEKMFIYNRLQNLPCYKFDFFFKFNLHDDNNAVWISIIKRALLNRLVTIISFCCKQRNHYHQHKGKCTKKSHILLTQGDLIAVKQACVDKKHVLNSGAKKGNCYFKCVIRFSQKSI